MLPIRQRIPVDQTARRAGCCAADERDELAPSIKKTRSHGRGGKTSLTQPVALVVPGRGAPLTLRLARAASGQVAAAPPSVAKNFRRPMSLAM